MEEFIDGLGIYLLTDCIIVAGWVGDYYHLYSSFDEIRKDILIFY